MRRKREGKGSPVHDASTFTAQRGCAQPQRAHLRLTLGTRGVALAKEVGRSTREEVLTPLARELGDLTIDGRHRTIALLARQRSAQWRLARTGRSHVTLAQAHEHRRRTYQRRRLGECITSQRVSHPDIAVEVGKGRHSGHASLVTLDHD